MKASELRIGSWVGLSEKLGSGGVKIVGLKFGVDNQPNRIQYDDNMIWNLLEDFEPIPLTRDIFDKCGFDYDASYDVPKVQKKNVILFDAGDGSFGANFGHIEQLDVSVKYLHQLQNLYYSLTGTELTYNPTK